MIFTVYRLELFKMRKRLASWVTYLCFLTLMILIYGVQYYGARQSHGRVYFGYPDALPAVLTVGAAVASTFCVVLVVLMVCNEFDWKTSRQNIIDGLAKWQWLTGKVLLMATIALVLYLSQLAVGGTLAFMGTSAVHRHAFDPTATYVLAACGALLGTLCYASLALLICVSVRSTGPTLAIALIYQVFDNIAARILRGLRLGDIADWLPYQVLNALTSYNQYQPYGSAARSHLEAHWQTGMLFLVASAWVAMLLSVSYKIFTRRDL
ncbi:MAG TPA: ABC transporter permease subunit [Steroidobacteraceae bacterium]|nr:ABC transporter permease subunit [Steroidobacteraceae bacterium]